MASHETSSDIRSEGRTEAATGAGGASRAGTPRFENPAERNPELHAATSRAVRAAALAALVGITGCSSLHTVRVQPETVHVAPGLRPVAGIQAHASSFYVLFIPVPGVSLDRVVNQMLVVAAKTMGADKVAQLEFHVDSTIGFWCFWGLLCQRDAWAKGIAVQVEAPPEDTSPDQGPEAPAPVPPGRP